MIVNRLLAAVALATAVATQKTGSGGKAGGGKAGGKTGGGKSSGGISDALLQAIPRLIPGVVTTAGGLDVAASVCETFKPGNQFGAAIASVFGSPYYGGQPCVKDTSGGSGPYKANYTTDPSLPAHTIYAPLTPPPANVKMPVVLWANGACLGIGTMFQNFLTELASHGFLVVANGDPIALAMTNYNEVLKSMEWVTTNAAVKRFGNIDLDNIAFAGQSCGGVEAYTASTRSTKHKLTVLFNSPPFPPPAENAAKMSKPIAYFTGGKTDMATPIGLRDYNAIKAATPALLADADVGHIGTYYQASGGKIGKIGVAFFKWKLQGDQSQKPKFCGADTAFTGDGWNIKTKNGMC